MVDLIGLIVEEYYSAGPSCSEASKIWRRHRLALHTVEMVHKEKPPGDILVFLESVSEVESAVSKLRDALPDFSVRPLYSSLSKDNQAKAFCDVGVKGRRKCIAATSVLVAVGRVRLSLLSHGSLKSQNWKECWL